jgi:chromosome segregation ATPase
MNEVTRSDAPPPTGRLPGAGDGTLESELDRISLNQALLDTEVATGRVVDLSRRLVEAADQIASLQAEIEQLKGDKLDLEEQLEGIRKTKAFRTADRLWALRRALRSG